MDRYHPDDPRHDHEAQRKADRRRLLRAVNISLGFVLALILVYSAQASFDWSPFAVAPHELRGLLGLLTAPLLHGSVEHITANATSLLILGSLAGSVYPRATTWSLPFLWIGSGLGAWWLGEVGSHHLGASGVTHGLMFLLFTLGLLRRDRAAIAAGMIAFFFYGGMLLTVLPHEAGISWQSHLGGAMGGVIAALLFRRLDPALPRKRYSWEDEEEAIAAQVGELDDELEPPAPREVPVLWHRPTRGDERGTVLKFPPRE